MQPVDSAPNKNNEMKYLSAPWQHGDVTVTVLSACDKNSSAAALPAA